MHRHEQINELLDGVREDIIYVRAEYEAARRDERIITVDRRKLKHCLSDLKSCLDFSAAEVREKFGLRGQHFPYGSDQQKFDESIASRLPTLRQINPDLYKIFEDVQPFVTGKGWLITLCDGRNHNEHNSSPIGQRVNSEESRIDIGNLVRLGRGSSITVTNGRIIRPDGHVTHLNLAATSNMPLHEIQRQVPEFDVAREYDWVEFSLGKSGYDALELLEEALPAITEFVSLIRPHLV